MMTSVYSRRACAIILISIYFAIFWSDIGTYRPGMDSMTYGAVARNMLATGDWAVPHYVDQAYKDFFQHPPLALWMMALSMKIIGWIAGPTAVNADWVLKLLPSLAGAACAAGVYLWGRKMRGEAFAFLATLVLLTSVRFAKYSKGFMLDPFLAVFSLWAVFAAVRGYAFISGTLVAAAFLSKGLFAFAPFAVIVVFLTARGEKLALRLSTFLVGCVLPLAAWLAFGDAAHYLARYYTDHVAGRVGSHPLRDHFQPLINLGKVYWPWIPFFVAGLVLLFRRLRPFASMASFRAALAREETAAALTALAFIGGFSLVASFLEQYHTATYPFAALVAAMGVPAAWERFRPRIEIGLLALLGALVVFMFAFPTALRSREHQNPIRIVLKETRDRCGSPEIRRIVISTGVAEIWYALAIGSWYTPWDVRSDSPSVEPKSIDAQLLLARDGDSIARGWTKTGIEREGYRVYEAGEPRHCGAAGQLSPR